MNVIVDDHWLRRVLVTPRPDRNRSSITAAANLLTVEIRTVAFDPPIG